MWASAEEATGRERGFAGGSRESCGRIARDGALKRSITRWVPAGSRTTLDDVTSATSTTLGFDDDLVRGLTAQLRATSGETFEEQSPLTGRPLATVPRSSADDIGAAVTTAREFQPRWAAVPVAERADCLLRLHDLLLDNQDAILDLICAESGKARMDAYMELVHLVLTARYYGRRAARLLRTSRAAGIVPGLTRVDVNRVPKGVVGLITPWNYPLTMALCDGIAALVAGNTVVHKPDSQTVLTALMGIALLRAAGVPENAWQVVAAPGREVGPQLVAGCDMIAFTGSTATGRQLATATAGRLTSISAELGGKNPLLVLADADLEAAAEGAARACFDNAGQLCVHIERIYVDARVYDEFRERLVSAVTGLVLAPGLGWDCQVGTLISPAQLAKVQDHVSDARTKGATVLCGGHPRPDLAPWCYEPTVLEGVTPAMRCHLDETFGPVVSLYRFDGEDEAVELANQGTQGLNASIWTTDHAHGRRIARRLRAGTVNINEGYAAALASIDAPMGGMGTSGMGRRQGAEGLLRFTEPQTVATQRLVPLTPFGPIGSATGGAEGFVRLLNRGLRVLRAVGRA
nr:succinic semialdehyde dehydrogenase [Brooklawnia cerclae]